MPRAPEVNPRHIVKYCKQLLFMHAKDGVQAVAEALDEYALSFPDILDEKLRKVVREYRADTNMHRLLNYGVTVGMQDKDIIPYAYIQRRLANVAGFYGNPQALHDTIKECAMLEKAEESFMLAQFGKAVHAYRIKPE